MRLWWGLMLCLGGALAGEGVLSWDQVLNRVQLNLGPEASADLQRQVTRVRPWSRTVLSVDSLGRSFLEPTFGLTSQWGGLQGDIRVGSWAPGHPELQDNPRLNLGASLSASLGGGEDISEEALQALRQTWAQAQTLADENQGFLEMLQAWKLAAEAKNLWSERSRVLAEETQVLGLRRMQWTLGRITETALQTQVLRVETLERELASLALEVTLRFETLHHNWFPENRTFETQAPSWLPQTSVLNPSSFWALKIKQFEIWSGWVRWERESSGQLQFEAQWTGVPGQAFQLGSWTGQVIFSWKPQKRPPETWRSALAQTQTRELLLWHLRQTREIQTADLRWKRAALEVLSAQKAWEHSRTLTQEAETLLNRKEISLEEYLIQRQNQGRAWLTWQGCRWEEALTQAQHLVIQNVHYKQWKLKKEDL